MKSLPQACSIRSSNSSSPALPLSVSISFAVFLHFHFHFVLFLFYLEILRYCVLLVPRALGVEHEAHGAFFDACFSGGGTGGGGGSKEGWGSRVSGVVSGATEVFGVFGGFGAISSSFAAVD